MDGLMWKGARSRFVECYGVIPGCVGDRIGLESARMDGLMWKGARSRFVECYGNII
jgi:hypothetical protein